MRTQDEIIRAIFNLYQSVEWYDWGEFMVVCWAFLRQHDVRSVELEDIRKELISPLIERVEREFGSYPIGRRRVWAAEKLDRLCEHDPELRRLDKYEDAEEAFSEELNSGPETMEYFESVCNRFLIFKQQP